MKRLLAAAAIAVSTLLTACGGEAGDGPPLLNLRLSIQPGTLVARHGQSVLMRVDMASVPDSDLPTGYAFDLDEVAGNIDVSTAPCAAGVGSNACQDWTITPRAGAVPGQYDVNVHSIGSRAGRATGSFRLVVVSDPAPNHGAAVRAASKGQHVLVINDAGRVFGRGDNHAAEVRFGYQRAADDPLPLYEPHHIDEFVEVQLPPGRFVGVSATSNSSFAVRDDGTVWAWGYNKDGRLGLRAAGAGETIISEPRQVSLLANVRAVSAGVTSAGRLIPLVLYNDGRVRRFYLELGPRLYCEVVPVADNATECERDFTGVQAIAGAAQDAVFLKQDGSVWRALDRPCKSGICPPDNDPYTSGFGRVERLTGALPPAVAVASGLAWGAALAADGTVWQWERRNAPDAAVQVMGLADVIAISTDADGFGFALRRNGTVWVWDSGDLVSRQIAGISNAVALSDGYAISGDCGNDRGAVWRLDGDSATAQRLDGFGSGAACTVAPTRTVSVALEGDGRVVSSPLGIDCPGTCSAAFALGTQVVLNEAPALGWTAPLRPQASDSLSEEEPDWQGDPRCARSFSVDADTACALRFIPGGDRRLRVDITGAGRVTSSPRGIDCGDDCVQAFAATTDVTLNAVPELGFRFESYAGDVDCADGRVTMDAPKICIAQFVALPAPGTPTGFAATAGGNAVALRWEALDGPVARYRLERTDASGAVRVLDAGIDGRASSFSDGSALPNTAYTYRLFAINASGESAPAVASVITLPPTQAQLTVTVSGVGTVVSTPAGIDCSAGSCSAIFPINAQVQLAATPGAGYQLAAFGGDADCADGVVTLSAPLICTATFVQVTGQGWVQLGGGPLTVSGVPPLVSLAIGAGNVVHAAYPEAVPAGDVGRLRVKRFDGTAWQPLGDALNAGAITPASEPSLAFAPDGTLYVAWSQGNGVQLDIFVARFDGTGWVRVGEGGAALNYVAGSRATGPSLAFDAGGMPLVAWIEDGSVKFKRWTGVAWVPAQGVGTAQGPASASADRLRLVTYSDGIPVLAWTEGAGMARAIRVVRDFTFTPLGTQVNVPTTASITQFGVLADRNGPAVPGPTVTWAQGIAPYSVLARRWDGSAWVDNASPIVNNDPAGLISFAMARNGAAVARTSGTQTSSALQVNQRFNLVFWNPLGPPLEMAPNATLRALTLEMTSTGLPIVGGFYVDQTERFQLHVYGYFP